MLIPKSLELFDRLDSKIWKLVNLCGVVKQLVLPERDE